MLPDSALNAWLAEQDISILKQASLSGGCIGDSSVIYLSDGQRLFLKQQSGAPPRQFAAEAAGLVALKQAAGTEGLRIPAVEFVSAQSLVLEYIEPGVRSAGFMAHLAEGLVQQHKTANDSFGFDQTTWCGATAQINDWNYDGHRFFAEQRLLWLAHRCARKKLLDAADLACVESICARLESLIPVQPAVLIHGDLWSGNVHCDQTGQPVLFDPAVYFGWAEAELAMTQLFGGFSEAFYRRYLEAGSVEPDWQTRAELYNLWHLLNHLSLFGRSYYQDVAAILNRYG